VITAVDATPDSQLTLLFRAIELPL